MHLGNQEFARQFIENKESPFVVYDMQNMAICIGDLREKENTYDFFPASYIASHGLTSHSWLWGWGNESLPREYKEQSVFLKNLGEAHQIPELEEDGIIVDPDDPLSKAFIMSSLIAGRFKLGYDALFTVDEVTGLFISRFSSEELCGLIWQASKCHLIAHFQMSTAGPVTYVSVSSSEKMKAVEVSDYALSMIEQIKVSLSVK